MTVDHFSPEYKTFRYLQSSTEEIELHRGLELAAANLRPECDSNNPDFIWPNRVEFPEQLMYMQHMTLYIVLSMYRSSAFHDSTQFITLENPTMVKYNPLIHDYVTFVNEDDRPTIGHRLSQCCLVDGKNIEQTSHGPRYIRHGESLVFKVNAFPVASGIHENFTELFYDYDTAKKYEAALARYISRIEHSKRSTSFYL